MRSARLAVLFLVLMAAVMASCVGQSGGQLLAEADELYDRWSDPFDFDAYQADLTAAIERYDEALPLIPADMPNIRASVLNRLARACFELGAAYLSDRDELESIYERGKTMPSRRFASIRLSARPKPRASGPRWPAPPMQKPFSGMGTCSGAMSSFIR